MEMFRLNVHLRAPHKGELQVDNLCAFLEGLSAKVLSVDTSPQKHFAWVTLESRHNVAELEVLVRDVGFDADVFDADEHELQGEQSHDFQQMVA